LRRRNAAFEHGYQRIFPGGFVFGITSGWKAAGTDTYNYNSNSLYWSFQLGYAFKHPFIRAR